MLLQQNLCGAPFNFMCWNIFILNVDLNCEQVNFENGSLDFVLVPGSRHHVENPVLGDNQQNLFERNARIINAIRDACLENIDGSNF